MLSAVLAKSVCRTGSLAAHASVAWGADAATVDRGTLGVVLALAEVLAALAVLVRRARSGALRASPAGLAHALACPGIAQLRVVVVALAHLRKTPKCSVLLSKTYIDSAWSQKQH